MMKRQSNFGWGLLLVGLIAGALAGPAEAKNEKDSTAEKIIKQIQEDIKRYDAQLKDAQKRMKEANEAGEKVEPLIEPTEKEMLRFKDASDEQQRKRAAASKDMQDKLASDPEIAAATVALQKAEARRDAVQAKVMSGIESEEEYQVLAQKRDASAKWLEQMKEQKSELDIPAAATALARDQGALATYVQAQLAEIPEYKAVADEADAAALKKRTTEQEAADRYRAASGLDTIDAVYEEKQNAYRASRDKLRELESQLRSLRSAYKDAEKDANWAARRIEIAKGRIEKLRGRK